MAGNPGGGVSGSGSVDVSGAGLEKVSSVSLMPLYSGGRQPVFMRGKYPDPEAGEDGPACFIFGKEFHVPFVRTLYGLSLASALLWERAGILFAYEKNYGGCGYLSFGYGGCKQYQKFFAAADNILKSGKTLYRSCNLRIYTGCLKVRRSSL